MEINFRQTTSQRQNVETKPRKRTQKNNTNLHRKEHSNYSKPDRCFRVASLWERSCSSFLAKVRRLLNVFESIRFRRDVLTNPAYENSRSTDAVLTRITNRLAAAIWRLGISHPLSLQN
eukprot:m.456947 g.456947  ORF g.456947 m.456947 type:complete len:119 (+) comp20327_c10_seq1:55-411(+)